MLVAKIRSIFLYALFLVNFLAFSGFPAGTLIQSSDMHIPMYIPLEELHVGDLVTCYDFKTGCYTEKPITAIKMYMANEILCLVVNNGEIESRSNEIEIFTAKEQRFYLPDQKIWKRAIDLRVGDCLFGKQAEKESLIIQQIKQFENDGILYDISVKNCHNFLIQKEGILVHNFAFAGGLVFAAYDSLACLAASCGLSKAILAAGAGAIGFVGNYLLSNSDSGHEELNSGQPDNHIDKNINKDGNKQESSDLGPSDSGSSDSDKKNSNNNGNNNGNNNSKSTLLDLAEAAVGAAGVTAIGKEIKKLIKAYRKSSKSPKLSKSGVKKEAKSEIKTEVEVESAESSPSIPSKLSSVSESSKCNNQSVSRPIASRPGPLFLRVFIMPMVACQAHKEKI